MFKACPDQLDRTFNHLEGKTLMVCDISIPFPLPMDAMQSCQQKSTGSREVPSRWLGGKVVQNLECNPSLAVLAKLHDGGENGIKPRIIPRFLKKSKLDNRT